MNKQDWFSAIDSLLVDFTGFHHDDIPDYNWWSLFEDEYSPDEAFEEWRQDMDYGFPSIY